MGMRSWAGFTSSRPGSGCLRSAGSTLRWTGSLDGAAAGPSRDDGAPAVLVAAGALGRLSGAPLPLPASAGGSESCRSLSSVADRVCAGGVRSWAAASAGPPLPCSGVGSSSDVGDPAPVRVGATTRPGSASPAARRGGAGGAKRSCRVSLAGASASAWSCRGAVGVCCTSAGRAWENPSSPRAASPAPPPSGPATLPARITAGPE